MTNQQLIPTQELLNQWCYAATDDWREIAAIAARWGYKQGADEELEACCEVLARELICDGKHVATDLHAIRRPKPPSLKEQALEALQFVDEKLKGHLPLHNHCNAIHTISRALEALDD